MGVGIVQADVQQASEASWEVDGVDTEMKDMEVQGSYFYNEDNAEYAEFVVPVKWIKTVTAQNAVKETGFFGNQNTVCRPTAEKWDFTVNRLKTIWGI